MSQLEIHHRWCCRGIHRRLGEETLRMSEGESRYTLPAGTHRRCYPEIRHTLSRETRHTSEGVENLRKYRPGTLHTLLAGTHHTCYPEIRHTLPRPGLWLEWVRVEKEHRMQQDDEGRQ
jgi:hypothetical protein